MKWDHRLEYQDNPGLIVSRAVQIARSEPRGPVYLSLPREIAFLPSGRRRLPDRRPTRHSARAGARPGSAARSFVARLVKARNPGDRDAALRPQSRDPAGAGAGSPNSSARRSRKPRQRTYQCFPFAHPLYQSITLDLSQADVVLVIEADVPWIPGRRSPPRDAYVAVIDIDPIKAHIGTYEFTANERMIADTEIALGVLQQAVEALAGSDDRARFAERSGRWADVSHARAIKDRELAEAEAGKTPISPRWLSYQIGQAMDANCLMLDETLMLSPLPPYLKFSEPGTYFRNPGSAGGWCAGAALGAKLGRPDKDVVTVTGDGFYMYSVANAAIASAVRYKAPFMSVIYQNRSYSTGTSATAHFYPDGYAVKGGLEAGYFDPPIDFAKEAEAAGAYGENVRDPAEVGPALRRGLEHIRRGTPAVIAVWLPKIMQDT